MRLKVERIIPSSWSTIDSQPEQFGLKKVAELSFNNESYEFDYRVVWQTPDGLLWTARDSGCSCPTPFEDVKELDRFFLQDVEEEVKEWLKKSYHNTPSVTEMDNFRKRIKEVLGD